jgi:DUF2075 family protein
MPYYELETEEKDFDYDYYMASPAESFYIEAIDKLRTKWNMLTQEEEELIMKISNRF